MKKNSCFFAGIIIFFSSVDAYALTAQEEFIQKCELQMAKHAKDIEGSIYADKRICSCAVEEIAKITSPEQQQDIADFYNEKYNDALSKEQGKDFIPRTIKICVTRFYTDEQQAQELDKNMRKMKEQIKTVKEMDVFKKTPAQ